MHPLSGISSSKRMLTGYSTLTILYIPRVRKMLRIFLTDDAPSSNHFGYITKNFIPIPNQRKVHQKGKLPPATSLSHYSRFHYTRCTTPASKLLQSFTPVYAITPFNSAVISSIRFATASAPCFTYGIRWIPTLTAVAPRAIAL